MVEISIKLIFLSWKVLGFILGWFLVISKGVLQPEIIFSPTPVKEYDLKSLGGYSAKIQLAKNANLIFIAAGQVGIMVVDSITFNITSTINLNNEDITGLAVTSDGKYVMTGYQNMFSVFQYQESTLNLLSQVSFQGGVIMDVNLDKTETVAFGFGMPGQVCAYNILDKKNAIFLTKYNTQSNRVRQLYPTFDNKYLYLADSTFGLNILQISNSQGQYSLKSIACGTPSWDVMDVTFTQDYQNTIFYWKCFTGKNDNYFYGIFDSAGVFIIKYDSDPYNMEVLSTIMVNPTDQCDFIWVSPDETIMILGISTNQWTLQVMDISDKSNPVLLDEVTKNPSNDTDGCAFTDDMTRFICANGGDGIFIADTTVITKISIIMTWPLESFMTGTAKDVAIKDNKFILGAIRNFGMCILELVTPNLLKYRNHYMSHGGEGIVLSNDKKFVFLRDGINGVTIINVENLPNYNVTGSVQLEGWDIGGIRLQQDNYIIAISTDVGYSYLLNTTDKSNPYLLSKYNPNTEIASNGCVDKAENYLFILTYAGFRAMPIRTNLFIHTEIIQITGLDSGSIVSTPISKFHNLQVGQTIEFQFLILYPEKNIKINTILYVDNYEIKSIPYWMTYSSSTQVLTMSIVKEALGSGSVQVSLNTVIVQTLKQISPSDFTYNDPNASTTAAQSSQIYNYLKSILYIDNNGYLTSLFDPMSDFSFSLTGIISSQRLYTLIKLTLARTFYQNPVIFYIQSSLSVDFQRTGNYIVSESMTITIYLQINSLQGKFVALVYAGVITSTTDKLDEIKLEGSIDNINRALNSGIYISRIDFNNTINVVVTVQDGTNYDFSTTVDAEKIKFVSFQNEVKAGESLQSQINQWYSGGSLNIETDLSFQFSTLSFVCPPTVSLSYIALLEQGDQFKALPSDFWLQFDKNTIKFYGVASTGQYRKSFTFRLNATDGYTTAYQDFTISLDGLPFTYVINMLIQVLGPLIAVLGVFQYKYQIFNIIFKSKTTYSEEIAFVNKKYLKMLTIIGDDLLKARLIFDQFREKTLHISNNNELPSKNDDMDKKFFKIQTQESVNMPDEIPEETSSPLKKQPYYQNKIKRQKLLRDPNIDVSKFMSIIHSKNKMVIPNLFQRIYLNDDGTIKNGKIFRECIQMDIVYKINSKLYSVKNDVREFKNQNSRLYVCFKSVASRFFLSIDDKSLAVYTYMKLFAMSKFSYSHNDWYKAYVNIIHSKREDKYNQLEPFPKISLKEEMIKEVFFDLNIINDKNQNLSSVRSFRINFPLIRNVLIADCFGLIHDPPSFLWPCAGESIHLQYHEIRSVEAFQFIKESMFMKLRRAFGIDYVKLCLQKNKSLPNWMNFDMRNGIIILEGTPACHDVDDLLIRVYDENEYIILQFKLKIADEYDINDNNEINDEEYKDTEQLHSVIDDTMFKSKIDSCQLKDRKDYKLQESQFKISTRLAGSPDQSSNILKCQDTTERKFDEEQAKYVSVTNIQDDMGSPALQDFTSRNDDISTQRQGQLILNQQESAQPNDFKPLNLTINEDFLDKSTIDQNQTKMQDGQISADITIINDISAIQIVNFENKEHYLKSEQSE